MTPVAQSRTGPDRRGAWLDEIDLRAAAFVTEHFVRTAPVVPASVQHLGRALTTAIMSAHGPHCHGDTPHWNTQAIDTAEAAEILGTTPRHIRRIAHNLDGQHASGRWIFNRATVTRYAQERSHRGRDTHRGRTTAS
jgi:hypothetical protein